MLWVLIIYHVEFDTVFDCGSVPSRSVEIKAMITGIHYNGIILYIHHSISNHLQIDCLFKSLLKLTAKNSKLCFLAICEGIYSPDSKVHGANMGPTWVLLAPDGPHVGPINFAIWEVTNVFSSTKGQ